MSIPPAPGSSYTTGGGGGGGGGGLKPCNDLNIQSPCCFDDAIIDLSYATLETKPLMSKLSDMNIYLQELYNQDRR